MLRTLLFACFLFVDINVHAQLIWAGSLNAAKTISAASGKFLVIDFWAPWCAPCALMETRLWGSEEMKNLSERFVAVKVNVDTDRAAANTFRAQAIPKVVVATYQGDVIWEITGFGGPGEYLSIFRALPADVSSLFGGLRALEQNRKSALHLLAVADEYQRLAVLSQNSSLKNAFLTQSARFLRTASGSASDIHTKAKVELFSILNDIFRGNPRKALKSIEKFHQGPYDAETGELINFVSAFCYYAIGDMENYHRHQQLITDKDYLERLGR